MKIAKPVLACIACALVITVSFVAGMLFQPKSISKISSQPVILQPSVDAQPDQVARPGTALLFGKIDSINMGKDATDVDFQLVEWVNGSDNQEQAALETDVCTLDRIENDECLPNHFFVRNTQKRISLPVSKDIVIEAFPRNSEGGRMPDSSGNSHLQTTGIKQFAKLLADFESLKEVPFIITTTHGTITHIREQYIP